MQVAMPEEKKERGPGPLEALPVFVVEMADKIVEVATSINEKLLEPIIKDPKERRMVAIALAGDILGMFLIAPLDEPIDIAVTEKFKREFPEFDVNKYRRIFVRLTEHLPIIELLPNYTLAVRATLREMKMKNK